MSDTLDNLLSRSGGGYRALPAPAVLNPLAAMAAATETAQRVYQLRGQQATEAIGQALQQATDPNTGVVDYDKFKAIAAGDSRTAMGMVSALSTLQPTQNEAYTLHIAHLGHMNRAMGQLIADYPHGVPADAMHAAIDRGIQEGKISAAEGATYHQQVSADPSQNSRLILQGISTNLDAGQALTAAKPQPTLQDVGGRMVLVNPPPQLRSGGGPPDLTVGGGVTTGPPPGETVESGRWVRLDDGRMVWQSGRVPLSTQIPPGGARVAPPGGGGGGGGPAPKPPAPGTQLPTGYQPRPTAPPATGGSVGGKDTSPSGGRSDIGGGPAIASANDTFAPTTGPAAPPSSAVAGDVAAIMQGVRNAQATPSRGVQTAQAGGGVFFPSGPPMGSKEQLDADQKVANESALSKGPLQDNVIATEKALQALRLSRGFSGPGTAWQAQVQALLEANGLSPGDPTKMSAVDWRQIAQKNLLRLAEQQAGTRTNLGLETGLHANPNMDAMLTNANEHVLLQDLGRARQRMAQVMLMPPADTQGSAIAHVRNYSTDTDYRGFAWDQTPKDQRDAIEKEVAKDPKAAARLDKAIEDAVKLGLFKVPPAKGKPQQSGAVMPPQAPQQPNLLAYPVA